MFRTFAGLVRKGVRNDFWPKVLTLFKFVSVSFYTVR